MVTTELKQRILKSLAESREKFYGSDERFSTSLGINSAQYSRIKNGNVERVLSDDNWLRLARRLNVSIRNAPAWSTAETPVYKFITRQLEACQSNGISAMLCDLSDIGKTYTAKRYAESHANAKYIDCSRYKTKQKLIRAIAREFGVTSTGRYSEVFENLTDWIKATPNPIIILDEFGDLNYDAILEIKALWNATEENSRQYCAYYVMGADGLRQKISRAIDGRKVGYSELFSRFGKKYGHVIPDGGDGVAKILRETAALIIKANASGPVNVNQVLNGAMGEDGRPSLRRIYTELSKVKVA